MDDLRAAHRRATEAGVKVFHPPRTEPWGETARYEDPDGNVVSKSNTDFLFAAVAHFFQTYLVGEPKK